MLHRCHLLFTQVITPLTIRVRTFGSARNISEANSLSFKEGAWKIYFSLFRYHNFVRVNQGSPWSPEIRFCDIKQNMSVDKLEKCQLGRSEIKYISFKPT